MDSKRIAQLRRDWVIGSQCTMLPSCEVINECLDEIEKLTGKAESLKVITGVIPGGCSACMYGYTDNGFCHLHGELRDAVCSGFV